MEAIFWTLVISILCLFVFIIILGINVIENMNLVDVDETEISEPLEIKFHNPFKKRPVKQLGFYDEQVLKLKVKLSELEENKNQLQLLKTFQK